MAYLISDHIIMIPIYWTAVLCVGLYHGAYIAEVIRSEFSLFLAVRWRPPCRKGFTYISAMRLIILPQAFRIIPPSFDQPNRQPSSKHLHRRYHLWSGLDVCDQVLVGSQWKLHSSLLGAALLYFSLSSLLPSLVARWSKPTKSLFTLGGYYGIHF